MNDVRLLVDKLKNAGLQPVVTISVDPNTQDIQAIKNLQTNLKNAGITAQVQINLTATSAPAGETSLPDTPPPAGQDRLGMMVKEARLNCFTFRKLDNAGKPDMVFPQQRVLLQQGAKFFVSTTHKAGSKDTGNGIVIGTGNHEYYFVVDCPSNPAAVGLYVRKIDIEPSP
jgi:hypothetical protein